MELVTVYWRPGCPYCARLRQDLRVAGVPAREINIWADEDAAATVRELANGNETVPTVVIGSRGLVNPSAAAVVAEVRKLSPGFAPDPDLARAGRRLRLLRVAKWTVIAGLIAASFAAESAGHAGLSWALDGVAIAAYLTFRLATATAVR
ncbi:MAG: glutaredoxin family protein [Streptosporangiaceae bacterium]